jgi:hypothetical protein
VKRNAARCKGEPRLLEGANHPSAYAGRAYGDKPHSMLRVLQRDMNASIRSFDRKGGTLHAAPRI